MTSLSSESLYAIIDPEVSADPLGLARRVLAAGCAMVQVRAKRLDDRSLVDLALALKDSCTSAGVPFVVNDRADIARIVGADGLHLGQDDLSIADARRIVGAMSIGVSTHDADQAAQAEREGADLIAFGPVFPTRTKENPDPVVGLDRLRSVCATVARPVVAIGGISPENARETLRHGARYVAAISALPRFIDGSAA